MTQEKLSNRRHIEEVVGLARVEKAKVCGEILSLSSAAMQ